MDKKPEILAPAGSMEAVAIYAVEQTQYILVEEFSARQNATT